MNAGNSVAVFAPGKLMIAGEYTVLRPQGKALAVAVKQGVRVHAEPTRDRWELVRDDTGVSWRDGDGEPTEALRFACEAMQLARQVFANEIANSSVAQSAWKLTTERIDGDARSHQEGAQPLTPKMGLGSSASVVTAVTAAVFAAYGAALSDPLVRRRILDVALSAHRHAQGERGSGYDVATSLAGGVVVWTSPYANADYRLERLTWPDGVYALAGFTGRSASTNVLIRKTDAAIEDVTLKELSSSVEALIRSFSSCEVDVFLSAVNRCQDLLSEWDRRHQLGIMTREIIEMQSIARRCGAVVKVSGAGGGDSVLAFSDRPDALMQTETAWRDAGFFSYPLQIANDGVQRVPLIGDKSL